MTEGKQWAVIDRIVDGSWAVLVFEEGQRQLTVPVGKLPQGSREGMWLAVRLKDGELAEAELDLVKTEEVKARIQLKRARLLERMRQRQQGGT
ncbi:MAG TPA: DUF3006 domain-containing protein [Limnochordia bacterium]|nr:DUF3006 domain-containing protein [Limnochordia bacterium]HPT83996.1 DUF3006 domain-containing protein [Limnochordia bacterium]